MPRKRFVDPGFWLDPHIAKLSIVERLLFLGCISMADDEGRLLASPRALRAQIFPYDHGMTDDEVKEMRDHIVEANPNVLLYEVRGIEYIAFARWERYQKPKYRVASILPAPPCMTNSSQEAEKIVRQTSLQVGLGRDRLGKSSSGIGKGKNDDHQESQERTEREKTIGAYIKLYTASPPGVDVPYHLYPSEAMQDKVEEMADIWGDDVVQDAIKEAVNSGKPQLPPRYIESIIFRWKQEGRIKPVLTEEEYVRLQEEKR